MCGIVGYVGSGNAKDVILDGLKNWSTEDMTLPA